MPRPAPATFPAGEDAVSLIEAGQAAERSGHRHEARACFETALYRLRGNDAGPQAASLLRWIARTYMMDANPDAAMDCADAALAVAQACGDKAGEAHAINAQAAVHWAHGDLDSAEALFHVARACALGAEERAVVAMTSHNLGVIANIRGDLPEALHHYSVGLENYRALGRLGDVCAALNNMGRLYMDQRRWPDAERAYTEAIDISNTTGDVSARIGLEVNVAEMWTIKRDALRAAEALDHAERLSAETGDDAWIAHIAKLRGILRRDAGAPKEAEHHFAKAVELAETRQDLLLLAETLRERAELFRGEGRNREALQNLNRSHRLFTQLRAKRELANVDRSVSRLENDFLNVVERWGESIEAKDRYTQGHCVRVANLSCAIASASGFDEQVLFWFRIGALLHDVGKLIVPSEVLNKEGKLTTEEWALMRSHPVAGVDMLAGIDFPWDVRPLIESHHERWDGTGYPHRLSGEAIPLSARILAVADVYDALTSVRSYKAALSHDAAMDVMRGDVGSMFDPAVFAKFEDAVRSGAAPEWAPQPARATGEDMESPRAPLELSTDDPLTSLPLRDSMERITAQALADRQTINGTVSLLVLELDAASASWQSRTAMSRDRVLRWIARELRHATRTSDFVARTGDHQFMALLPGSPDRQAQAITRRVQAALSRRLQGKATGNEAADLIRIAVVTSPRDGETATELFQNAERLCRENRQLRRMTR